MTTLEQEKQYRLVQPEHLDISHRRYLADNLISELRKDRWHLRSDNTLLPIEAPGDAPGWSIYGGARATRKGSSHVLWFTCPAIYAMSIPQTLVALDAGDYNDFCGNEITRHLPHLDRLLRVMHGNTDVFKGGLKGYGTNKQNIYERGPKISKAEADAALALLEVCVVAKLT